MDNDQHSTKGARMPRIIEVPAQTVRLEIRQIEEVPESTGMGGMVRVHVGRVDAAGAFIVPQQFETYEIRGRLYDALVGPAAPDWAPDKPEGTYRNEHLWHCIDVIRDATERAAAIQREMQ